MKTPEINYRGARDESLQTLFNWPLKSHDTQNSGGGWEIVLAMCPEEEMDDRIQSPLSQHQRQEVVWRMKIV